MSKSPEPPERKTSSWFFNPQPRPDASVRLFCFPYAGSGASVYHSWPGAFGNDVEVLGVQPPGRETRIQEPAFLDALELARAATDAIVDRIDRPFAFFGHSMGALIAFEVARELRRRDVELPAFLSVSSKNAPRLGNVHGPISHLPEEEFLDAVRENYRPPEEAWQIPELLEFLLPILRADLTVCDRYRYTADAPLDTPIRSLGGESDPGCFENGIVAWREETTEDFAWQVFEGGHFYIEEHLETIQALIAQDLARTTGRS